MLSLSAAALLDPDCVLGADEIVNAHGGPILPPVTVPDARIRLADGRQSHLRTLLADKTSAVQLVFTRCTTTCPMQATLFQRVQRLIPDQLQRGSQLVSVSIDPAEDSPHDLQEWLGRFGARPGWIAAVPHPEDL